MKAEAELEPFVRLIEALEPWLEELVLIGGWAHRLYRLAPRVQGLGYPPLTTLDSDIAVPSKIEAKGDQHPGLPAGGRISGRVHRGGPASRDALPPGWSERILCGISQSTCWQRVWTEGRTQGHQGSGRNFLATIALHRDSIARTLAHTSEQDQRIPIRIGEAGAGSKSSKFYNSEDSYSRCTRPQRTGEGYSLHSRHD